MKLLCTPLALLFLLFTSSFLEETGGSVICNAKCTRRCAKASFHDRCHKYCVGCCEECRCVPSGTYGNKDECPCYRDKLNSKKQPKCP